MNRLLISMLALGMTLALAACAPGEKNKQAGQEQPVPENAPRLAEFQQAAPVGKDARLVQAFSIKSLPPLARQTEEISGSFSKGKEGQKNLQVVLPIKTSLDPAFSADKNGSLKVVSHAPGRHVIELYPVKGISGGPGKLAYRAKVATSDVRGQVYLQLVVKLRGEEPKRVENLLQSVRSASYPNWVEVETTFRVPSDKTVEQVRLNFVLHGMGTAWIDDLKLYEIPPPATPSRS